MTPQSDYRWLQIAGFVTLALAALVLVAALNRAASEKRTREDVGVRVQEMMNTLEAEAQRMENAASRP
jgi:type VI protein secretion system component VasK